MTMITTDDYLDAFKEMCNYDDIDAKYFGSKSLEAIIRDDIENRLEDGLMFTKEVLSKVVEDALYSIQYGDTVMQAIWQLSMKIFATDFQTDDKRERSTSMIFVTGDIHGEPKRLSMENFPEQKEMCREDYVIICGDFGLVFAEDKESKTEAGGLTGWRIRTLPRCSWMETTRILPG